MFVDYLLPAKRDFLPMTYQTGVSEYAQPQNELTANPHHEGALGNVQKADSLTIPRENAKSIVMPLLGFSKTHQQTDAFKTAHQDPIFTTIQKQWVATKDVPRAFSLMMELEDASQCAHQHLHFSVTLILSDVSMNVQLKDTNSSLTLKEHADLTALYLTWVIHMVTIQHGPALQFAQKKMTYTALSIRLTLRSEPVSRPAQSSIQTLCSTLLTMSPSHAWHCALWKNFLGVTNLP